MELIVRISRAKDKVRAGFLSLSLLKVRKFIEEL